MTKAANTFVQRAPSKYFVRVLTRTQCNELIEQLQKVASVPIKKVKARQEFFEAKAPDGDMVFSGLLHSNRTHYLCRLHREVFCDG